MPLNEYYTPVEGMYGTGKPLVPNGAVLKTEGAAAPQNPTGGTYSQMKVNADVKKAIQEGSAGDFFYFIEQEDGTYELKPKLPEQGRMEKTKDRPNPPVFQLRVNNNRLMKGIASKFLKDPTIEIPQNASNDFLMKQMDLEKGRKFLCQMERYFAPDGRGTDLVDQTLSGKQVFDRGVEWLCTEFAIPEEERKDFANFCEAAFSRSDSPYVHGHFWIIWENFCDSVAGFQMAREKAKDIFVPEKIENESSKQLANAAEAGYIQTVREFYDLANINPVETKELITITECSGSADANIDWSKLANQAKEDAQTAFEAGKYEINSTQELQEKRNENQKRQKELREKLEIWIEYPPLDESELEAYNQEIQRLSSEIVEAEEQAKQLEGELKWGYHQAPVLGSFTYNGQTYYLTAEAFAPEAHMFMEHPGVTGKVAVGVYKDLEDFKAYYRKDNSFLESSEAMQKYMNAKANSIQEGRFSLADNITLGYFEMEKAGIRLRTFLDQQAQQGNRYERRVVLSEIQQKLRERNQQTLQVAANLLERIPDEHEKQAIALKDAVERLNLRFERTLEALCYYQQIEQAYGAMGNFPREAFDQIKNYNQKQYEMLTAAGATMHSLLEQVFEGKLPQQEPSEETKVLLNDFFSVTGYSLDSMLQFGNDIYKQLIPGIEVKLAGQATTEEKTEEKSEVEAEEKTEEAEMTFSEEVVSYVTEKKTDVTQLTARTASVIKESVDEAFITALSERMTQLKGRSQSMMDYVFVNGESLSSLCKGKYPGKTAEELEDLMKSELMMHLFNGDLVDVATVKENGTIKILPVSVVTEDKKLKALAKSQDQNVNKRTPEYLEQLRSKAREAEDQYLKQSSKSITIADEFALKEAAQEYVAGKGGAARTMYVNREIKEELERANSLYHFEAVSEEGEGKYKAQIRLPERVKEADGTEIDFRENYNWLIRGIARQFMKDGKVEMTPETGKQALEFLDRMRFMYIDELGMKAADPRNPLATPAEVHAYRDSWLCEMLNIPEEKQKGFLQFMKYNCNSSMEYANTSPLTRNNFGKLWETYAGKLIQLPDLDRLSKEGKTDFERRMAHALQTLTQMAEMDPVTEMKAYVPTECSGSASFLTRLEAKSAGRLTKDNTVDVMEVRAKGPGHAWDFHHAAQMATRSDGTILTAEAFAPEETEYFADAAMTSDIYFGVYKNKEAFEAYYNAPSTVQKTKQQELDEKLYSDTKMVAEGHVRDLTFVTEVKPNTTQISEELLQQALKYSKDAAGMSRADKTMAGEKLIETLTGVKLKNQKGDPDLRVVKTLLSHIHINGVAYQDKFNGEVNRENFERLIHELAGDLANQMDVSKDTLEIMTILSGNELKPLTYRAKAPEAVAEPEKKHFFTSSAKKAAIDAQQKVYEEYLQKKAEYDRWMARNARVSQACQMWNQIRNDQIENESLNEKKAETPKKMKFSELTEELAKELVEKKQWEREREQRLKTPVKGAVPEMDELLAQMNAKAAELVGDLSKQFQEKKDWERERDQILTDFVKDKTALKMDKKFTDLLDNLAKELEKQSLKPNEKIVKLVDHLEEGLNEKKEMERERNQKLQKILKNSQFTELDSKITDLIDNLGKGDEKKQLDLVVDLSKDFKEKKRWERDFGQILNELTKDTDAEKWNHQFADLIHELEKEKGNKSLKLDHNTKKLIDGLAKGFQEQQKWEDKRDQSLNQLMREAKTFELDNSFLQKFDNLAKSVKEQQPESEHKAPVAETINWNNLNITKTPKKEAESKKPEKNTFVK